MVLFIRQLISLLLIPVTLLSASGLVVFTEHCGMREKTSYTLSDKQSCCCKKAVHDKCCKQNKHQVKKIDNPFQASSSHRFAGLPFHATISFSEWFFPEGSNSQYVSFHPLVEPPDTSIPFTVLHSCFLL
jgi:hypothetical protein